MKVTSDLYVRSLSTRLTYQAAKNIKVAGFLERWWHKKGHTIGAGTDIRAGEQRDPKNAHHAIGNMTVTAPVTNNWLIPGRILVCRVLLEGRSSERLAGPARRGSALHAGVVCDGANGRFGAEQELPGSLHVRHGVHALEHHSAAAAGKRPQRHEGVSVVRDRLAQHQGGHREHLWPRPPAQEHAQRPPDGVLRQQPADFGHRLQQSRRSRRRMSPTTSACSCRTAGR